MKRRSFFDQYKHNKQFQKLYREEKELLDIAVRISTTRKRKNITQVQLAKKAGMPQSQIARIESGNHNVTLGTLHRVAGALNLKVRVAA